MSEPSFELLAPFPSRLETGKGQIQVLSGNLNWPGHQLTEIKLLEPEKNAARMVWFSLDRKTGNVDRIEFRLTIPWQKEDKTHSQAISLQLGDDQQQTVVLELGVVELVETASQAVQAGQTIGDDPLIVICMASYQPDPVRLARQVESILCQSYRNWMLIISDDASDSTRFETLKAIANLDSRRIRLIRNTDRAGYYGNFERALLRVPVSASMVALTDQDDEWYPEKLQRLASRLNADDAPALVYSDMRIVDESGALLANSFWGTRKNEYRDFDSLLLNNTVTGAATLFKRELLETLLPFPQNVGEMFHDHWLACVARSVGELAYINDPLYDYYQYQDSVIGHRTTPLAETIQTAGDKWEKREQGYRDDCQRIQLISDTLKLRLPDLASNASLNLMNGGVWSMLKLFKTYLKGRVLGRTRGGAELGLMMGFAAHERQKCLRQEHSD